MPSPEESPTKSPRVGLFVTCLVDLFRPNVGFAAVKLLQQAGCLVEVPTQQTCCGQPALNSGDLPNAQAIAVQVIDAFSTYDYIVGASGSCMGTLKTHYTALFKDDPVYAEKAANLAARSYELISFLTDQRGIKHLDAAFDAVVTYHDSCSGLRELGIKQQPRTLLAGVKGLRLAEMTDSEVCCGFGGTFCVKYPDISERMSSDKVAHIDTSGADTLLAGDLGCLMNISGRLSRLGKPVQAYHIAEVLADMTADVPAIGAAEPKPKPQSSSKSSR